MWYAWFAFALIIHVGISFLCAWFFRAHTAYCTVPKPEAYEKARAWAEATRAQGEHFTSSDFMVFCTATYEQWLIRPWVAIYFFAGLVALGSVLIIHLISPGVI